MTAGPNVYVRLDSAASSGLADMVRQLLEQNLEESGAKRRRARSLSGRIVMNASDYDSTVTIGFRDGEITIWDGAQEGAEASISGPYETLVNLLQGESNPLSDHLRGRIRVRSSLRRPFFPLRVQSLMALEKESSGRRWWTVALAALAIAGKAAVVAIILSSGGW